MKNKIHLILSAAGLLITAFLIINFGPGKIILYAEKLGWWFAAAAGLWGIVYCQNAAAWYLILGKERKKVAFWRVYTISISSFAINYITPFITLGGEPYRISSIKEYLGIERSVSSVTLYRMVHVLAHLFFWLITIPLSYMLLPEIRKYTLVLLIFFVTILVLMFLLFLGHRKGFLETVLRQAGRFRVLGYFYRKASAHSGRIITIDRQIRELFNSRRSTFWQAVLMELFGRFTAGLEYYFIMKAIGLDISVPQAFYIHAVSSLFMNILFFMPLEMGSREGGLILAFQAFNFRPEAAIFVALVNRMREIFWILTGMLLIQINNRKVRHQEKLHLPDLRRDI